MEKFFEKLRSYIAENPPNFGDGDAVEGAFTVHFCPETVRTDSQI